eukprot:scaffold2409_cov121-Isochrysis_galbana.AAC.9
MVPAWDKANERHERRGAQGWGDGGRIQRTQSRGLGMRARVYGVSDEAQRAEARRVRGRPGHGCCEW